MIMKTLLRISLLLSLLASMQVGFAEEEQLALEIDADTTTCSTNLDDCYLEGNVVIKQGDTSITADKLYSKSETEWEFDGNITIQKAGMLVNALKANVSLEDRQIEKVNLVGSPVNFNYLVDNQGQANGQADKVSFDLNTRVIVMDGNARLIEGGNELTGEHIEYDLNQERFKANNTTGDKKGRVHLVFEPPKKKNESESGNTTNTNDATDNN